MRKKSTMKIARGRLEEEKRKIEDRIEYQRVMLFILPLLMVAILIVGIYFGYLSYISGYVGERDVETVSTGQVSDFTDEQNSELLTVVNSASPVDASYEPELSKVNGVRVNVLMVDDLTAMLKDAEADGMNIELVSGYISFEEQKERYDSAVKSYKKKHKCSTVKAEAAVKKKTPNAGESEQQTGLIIELSNGKDKKFEKTAEYNWLLKNSINYGFVLRYPDKENTGGLGFLPGLYRYVGAQHALAMRAYNMNLDEYVLYLGAQ